MDVVIFEVAGQRYALPATNVSEVLDPVPVTPLPYAPPFVDGLVNVAGVVVVQLDAAKRLGAVESLEPTRGSVLVIGDGNADSAVHVARVLTKATIADDDIARQEGGGGHENHFFVGSFQWKDTSVLVLDGAAFSLDDITAVGQPTGDGGLLGSAIGLSGRSVSHEEVSDSEFSCVIVQCNNERYGIPLHEVGEVVDDFNLTALPHAPTEVCGMALLRGAPLLGLSLSLMLGGSGNVPLKKMVVVERNGVRFGLLVEEVLGIENFSDGAVQQVEQGSEIDGYLIGANGAMIGLLGLNGLITEERFARYNKYLIKNNISFSKGDAALTAVTKVRMLTFRLGTEQCAIPLRLVERVEEYREITGLPGGDGAGLSGAVQIQGGVVPVIDLRAEMGGEIDNNNVTFLVVRIDGGAWALTVNQVERVIEINDSDIEQVKTMKTDYIGAVGRLNGRLISILTLGPLMEKSAENKAVNI